MRNQDFQVGPSVLEGLNAFLTNPDNPLLGDLRRVVAKYGSVEEINARAREAGRIESLLRRLERLNSPYIARREGSSRSRAIDPGSAPSAPSGSTTRQGR